ncbi:aldo/keto reductase [Pseudonocardia sp. CA-107938]|uniref:aldo/keto reductase n=1 Tax=Pseudonocardia sp. CA-107938 TaxID=3240021 RepID=UPI003D91BC59
MTTGTITADVAGTWQLGDLTVNRLGFGAMRIPGGVDHTANRERSVAVLHRLLDLGVNHIDTAAFYFSPLLSANELINSTLRAHYAELVITTKVGASRTLSGEFVFARPQDLRGEVLENLRQLGRDHLDVVNYRVGRGMDKPTGSIADGFAELAKLREEGLIRHLGLSNIGPEHLAEAQAIAPVVCVQNMYGLGLRGDDELLRLCGEQGVAFVPFFALAHADPASTPVRFDGVQEVDGDVIADVAAAHGATPAQIRLAWTLAQGDHVLAIPGTGDPAHLEENVAAGALRLTDDELHRLSTAVRS